MEIYLAIITTVLVLTQVIRLIQNASQIKNGDKVGRSNDHILKIYDKIEEALDICLMPKEDVEVKRHYIPDKIGIDIEVPAPFTQEAYDSIERQLEALAETLNLKTEGVYASVYVKYIQGALSELKKRIEPTQEGESK